MDLRPQHKIKSPEYDKKKVVNCLELIGTAKDFLNRSMKAHELRPTVNKLDLINLQIFSMAMDIIVRPKQQPLKWKKSSPLVYRIQN